MAIVIYIGTERYGMDGNKENRWYDFYAEDEDGMMYPIGNATQRIQDEDTDDEMVWWDGYIDTRRITFDNEEEMKRIIKKRFPNDEIYLP